MMKLNRGINLGGYLSQCVHTHEHYRSFIGEDDIKQIAAWGFDHIRLPIDCEVLETAEGAKKPEGYQYVSNAVSWSQKCNLNIILDLHKAYGYDFNNAGDSSKNNLFTSPELKKRFIRLWENISNEYGSYGNVAFELLNEVVEEENTDSWNQLIRETVSVIRKTTRETPIIYGGICWNSASTLKYLEVPQDKNTIFTFHFYEPLVFTHQKAYWVEKIDKKKDIFYPETMDYYRKHSAELGVQGKPAIDSQSEAMGPEFMREKVMEAIEAAEKAGVGLYCGEFGVIDQAPVMDTLRWFQDVDKVFRDFNIGCAVWTYKKMDFGLIDSHYDDIREDLITLWTGK
ncbi:MAG: glycoside hydrolase family 5 protein [Clostridiaceae bacterium]|jgi:aryl-phospho-beta-D-glucosidase BglC (GH1 family)|nr:glycoside hydrolase family 5 protein [Clostridiaceae bacterium]